jgi:formylglycine-generating enzyme required for sulfatase activity
MRHVRSFLLAVALGILAACSTSDSAGNSATLQAGTVITDPPVNIEMVYIPAGSFVMGSYNADDEDPPHVVGLAEYYIGKHEITQREWQAVMGNSPAQHVGENLPVENVSWEEAVEFAARLSEMTEQKYRLPTEAEWEYAARAGSTTDFHFGNDTLMLGDYAWHAGNSGGTTHPVGMKLSNDWGLHDVAGNVWEWCNDWWDPDFYERSDSLNPVNETAYLYTSPTTGEQFPAYVARSGAFLGPASGLESAHRHGGKPNLRRSHIGLRVVREVQLSPTQ